MTPTIWHVMPHYVTMDGADLESMHVFTRDGEIVALVSVRYAESILKAINGNPVEDQQDAARYRWWRENIDVGRTSIGHVAMAYGITLEAASKATTAEFMDWVADVGMKR